MPGKHKARIGRQGRNKRGAQRKNDGALWHNPRNGSEHPDLLRRKDHNCAESDFRVVYTSETRQQPYSCPLATTIVVLDNKEVWLCDKHADAWTPDTSAVKYWYEQHALYGEAS